MARKKSDRARMTLYRLVDLPSTHAAIREKYLTPEDEAYDYGQDPVSVAGVDAVLFWGKIERDRAGWTATVHHITGKDLPVGNTTASAVLLIPENHLEKSEEVAQQEEPTESVEPKDSPTSAWAITFGMGYQMLDQRYIDPGFGQKIAIRCAAPDGLNAISKTTLDERPQMVRSTIPSGGTLPRFEFEELGDLATRLVTDGHVEGIGDASKPVKVRGADSLNLPLSTSPSKLLDNLEQIKALLQKPPRADLEALEHISLVKSAEVKRRLDQYLIKAIGGASEQIALSYPYESIDEFGHVGGYKLYGTGQRGVNDYLPSLEDLLAPLRETPESSRLDKLGRLSIMLFKHPDDTDPASSKIPLKKWLTFQATIDNKRYFLQNNRWYVMDSQYVDSVQRQVEQIFARDPYFSDLPEWPIYQIPDDKDEQKKQNAELQYNRLIAERVGGLCLDQELIRPDGSRSHIEACDILLRGGVFVHVKHVSKSAPASHLLAQALVSTELLRTDESARQKLAEKIRKVGGDPSEYETKPRHVVIVMARNDKLTAESLFTFTKINLLRHDRWLSSMGVQLNIVPVVRKLQTME